MSTDDATTRMRALERAYAALGLPPGASADDIDAARGALLEAISPERFERRDPVRAHLERQRRDVEAAYELLVATGEYGDAVVASPDPRTVANLRVELSVHEFRLSRWRSQLATALATLGMGAGLSLVFADGGYVRLIFFALILIGGFRAMQIWQRRGRSRRGVERTTAALSRAMRGE